MAVTRRNSTPDDEALLFRLFAEHKAQAFALLGMGGEQLRLLVEMQYRARCAGYAADYPNAVQDIVELDGTPIGQILLEEDEQALRVVDIAIEAAYRGQGIATQVLRAICEQAATEHKQVRLRVIPHSAASRLYLRLGFVVTAHEPTGDEMLWTAAHPVEA